MKIFEALLWGENELRGAGVDNSRWDADCLLGDLLACQRERLYLNREQTLTEEQRCNFEERIGRRAGREPLQYILGRQEFMGLTFHVDRRVLIPRGDSEVLVEELLKWAGIAWGLTTPASSQAHQTTTGQGATAHGLTSGAYLTVSEPRLFRVADVCTGSGALAIAVAHYWKEARVVGTDISEDALAVARVNGERLKVQVEWRQGHFLDPLRGESWDVIISNPPYISEGEYKELAPEIFREPALAFLGGQDGLDYYRELAEKAGALLKVDGIILCEIGWQQGKAVQDIFQQKGYQTQIICDFGGRDRVVLARGSDDNKTFNNRCE